MFKLASKDEADTFIEKAQSLRAIESIKGFDAVKNAKGLPESNFNVSLIIDFETVQGLEDYLVHPVHVAFSDYVMAVKTDRACIDYEF